jgi:hypothetical protein
MKPTMKRAKRLTPEPTHYVNVDLDIYSRVALQGLVEAMGEDALVLYVAGRGQRHEAHLELASSPRGMTADRTIIGLTQLVTRLPPRYRRIWDSAKSREFNVGIEAGLAPLAFELRLSPRTVEAVTKVGGAVVVTVYAPFFEKVDPSRLRMTRTTGKKSRRSVRGRV